MTTRQARARAAVLGGGLALALALTGCTADTDAKARTLPTPAPAVTVTPAPATTSVDLQAKEKAAVLAAYSSMWTEQMKAYAKADAKGTDLAKYTSLDALVRFRLDLAQMKKAGTVATGTLGHEPEVTALDTTSTPLKATVQDCLDLSGWTTTRVQTGETIPLPSAQPRRYRATATAEKWPSGWMILTYTPQGQQSC
ncbi:hypothetical protein ACFY9C_36385 [Streptomyces filamentosus]|uniref:hypothetical protein n=1 Tax=Streptomyces filamentosus TaxID=67294 RepID=UPI0036EEDAAE